MPDLPCFSVFLSQNNKEKKKYSESKEEFM